MSNKQDALSAEWVQPYKGPLNKELALKLVADLKESPLIAEAIIIPRDARNRQKDEWDVVILIN